MEPRKAKNGHAIACECALTGASNFDECGRCAGRASAVTNLLAMRSIPDGASNNGAAGAKRYPGGASIVAFGQSNSDRFGRHRGTVTIAYSDGHAITLDC